MAEKPPLDGVRVIEMGTLIAGPYAACLLGHFGAEVIKIETPGEGDPLRKWRTLHAGTSYWWYSHSRNKKSVTVDLKAAEGQAIVRKLAATADIVVENFRPGVMEQWGLGWEPLSAANPSLIMLRISGYGQTGPYRDRPGFGAIAEAMGGLRYVTGYPDLPPVRVGVSIGDTLSALYGVVGALLAMRHLQQGGRGQVIDVALYEAVFSVMESLIPEFSATGFVRERTGPRLAGISPSSTYLCRDGSYVVIAGNADSIYKRLMTAIGCGDLAEDPRLAHNDGRARHNDLIDTAIGDWTADRDLPEVLAVLEQARVPTGKIYTAADVAADPHFRARDMLQSVTLPDGKQFQIPGIVPKLSETPGGTRWLGPKLGEHTQDVLATIGIEGAELDDLRARGIV
ncbi:MAG: CoA transferase [Acidimicrobiia bacterium]|nr:CoA transferase [Acidimicrobiia bacterium]